MIDDSRLSQTRQVLKRDVTRTLVMVFMGLVFMMALWMRLSGAAYAASGVWTIPATLMSYTVSIVTGGSVSGCYVDEAESFLSLGNLSRCVVQPAAHLVGNLCVTFGKFCSKQSVTEWADDFLSRNEDVSDVMVGNSSVTMLGQHGDVSWRLHALIDELDEEQTMVLYSALRGAIKNSPDQQADRTREAWSRLRQNTLEDPDTDSYIPGSDLAENSARTAETPFNANLISLQDEADDLSDQATDLPSTAPVPKKRVPALRKFTDPSPSGFRQH